MTNLEKYKQALEKGNSIIINSSSVPKREIGSFLNCGVIGKITLKGAVSLSTDDIKEWSKSTHEVIFDFTT